MTWFTNACFLLAIIITITIFCLNITTAQQLNTVEQLHYIVTLYNINNVCLQYVLAFCASAARM